MDILSIGQQLAIPSAKEAKTVINQTGESFEHSAKAQGVVTRGTPEEVSGSSLQFNPAKVQEREKWEIYEEFILRFRSKMDFLTETTLVGKVTPFNVLLGTSGAPLTKQPLLSVISAKLTGVISGIAAEMSAVRALQKDIMTTGFKIIRQSESLFQQFKGLFVRSESVIDFEAPMINSTASVVTQNGYYINNNADLMAVMCREELHRVANVFGLEADFLTAIVKTAVLMKSAGDIQMDANGAITLSSVGDFTIKTGGKFAVETMGGAKISSLTGIDFKAGTTMNLNAGSAISAQTSILNLHGMASANLLSSGAATVVGSVGAMPMGMAPVPPIDATYAVPPVLIPPIAMLPPDLIKNDSLIKPSETVRQAQGMGSVGGPIV
jgi:hypothetical protein